MTGTTHALVGATLGALIGRPGLAFAAGIASHVLLDRLPHNDYDRPLWLLLDGLGAFAVVAASVTGRGEAMLAGAAGAILPDVEHLFTGSNPEPRGIFPSHQFRHGARSSRQGLCVELVVATAALLALFGLLRHAERPTIPSSPGTAAAP